MDLNNPKNWSMSAVTDPEVEALAEVLYEAACNTERTLGVFEGAVLDPWGSSAARQVAEIYRAMARAAIAHLCPTPTVVEATNQAAATTLHVCDPKRPYACNASCPARRPYVRS